MKIVQVVNSLSSSSIPLEVATEMAKIEDVEIISLFENKKFNNQKYILTTTFINYKRFGGIISLYKIYKFLKKQKPDIIHVHHTLSGFFVSLVSIFFRKTDLISTIHREVKTLSFYQNILWTIIVNRSKKVICNSKTTKKSFHKWQYLFFDKEKLNIVYNGVNVDFVKSCKNNQDIKLLNKQKNYFKFLNVGRLIPEKNQAFLIKAFKEFNIKYPFTELIIVGDGILKSELIELCRKLDLNDKITFTGSIEREEVYAYMNNTDIFVIPSTTEGFGNALIEALCANIPVIASDIQTFNEILDNNDVLFFNPYKIHELVKCMERLYLDKDLREIMKVNARNNTGKYTLEKTVDNYLKIYKRML